VEGAHDLGGVGGFGVVRTPGSDATHAEPWELRVQWLALAACGGARPWIERIDTPTYLTTSYYGRWLLAAEMGVVANGLVADYEIAEARARVEDGDEPTRVDDAGLAAKTEHVMLTPLPSAPSLTPRFGVGDVVVPKRMWEPDVHHRCPRYVRGVHGTVKRLCGDERLAGYRPNTVIEPVYTIRFESADVWGERSAEPPFTIHVDLWESYLEPV
jgi:nitrile hydratase subunit beta